MPNDFEKLEKSVRPAINIEQTVLAGDRILIGFSGGPDSVYLAHFLYKLRDEKGLTLFLAHVNYKLRGKESDEDEAFCRAMAKKLNLPIEVLTADLSGLKSSSGNVQAAAREKRMKFFSSLAEHNNCNKIALGHTLDDNVETILGNIFRGCGLEGLSGIFPISGAIIRPLLQISKAEILEDLDKNAVPYRIDSSNLANDYTRNKIRNLILPELRKQVNPRVDAAVIRLSQIMSEAAKHFAKIAEQFCEKKVELTILGNAIISLEAFSRLDSYLKKYLIKYIAEKISGDVRGKIDFDLISSALRILHSETGTRADLGGGLMLEKDTDCLIVFFPGHAIESRDVEIPGKTVLHDYNLVLHSQLDDSPGEINHGTDNWTVKLDLGGSGNKFSIRQYRNGDYFQPLGMNAAKKLSDFFIDRKIPRALRPEIPLLVCGDEIAWVMGHEISEHFKIGPNPGMPLKLWVEKVVKKIE